MNQHQRSSVGGGGLHDEPPWWVGSNQVTPVAQETEGPPCPHIQLEG